MSLRSTPLKMVKPEFEPAKVNVGAAAIKQPETAKSVSKPWGDNLIFF
jgi:hypothetical protein